MDFSLIGRWIMIIGGLLVLLGAGLWLAGRLFPNLGQLPGDLRFEVGNLTVYFPLASMILVSVVGTLLLNLAFWLWRRFNGQ